MYLLQALNGFIFSHYYETEGHGQLLKEKLVERGNWLKEIEHSKMHICAYNFCQP